MPRNLRYVPQGGCLVEVTCRTMQGRLLLTPEPQLNQSIVGTLARAKRRYKVGICSVAFLSNHYHLLLIVEDASQLGAFMNFVNSRIAREVSRFRSWPDRVWSGRYRSVIVSDEPASQVGRMRYVLSQSVKEHLVESCADWPGVHAGPALSRDGSLEGYWFDRTAEGRRRGARLDPYSVARPERLELDALPCWAGLTKQQYRARVVDLIQEIEGEAAEERSRSGVACLGPEAIRRQAVDRRMALVEKRAVPLFHTVSRVARRSLMAALRHFLDAYREAADRLRAGDRSAVFPDGCFPPRLPSRCALDRPEVVPG